MTTTSNAGSNVGAALGSVSNTDPIPEAAIPLPGKVLKGGEGKKTERGASAKKLIVFGRGPLRVRPDLDHVDGLESVLGIDERTRILDTQLNPWRMICSLEIDGPNGLAGVGTGWLAGPKTLVTAGHCVFDQSLFPGGWASKLVIRPGRDADEEPFGRVEAKVFSTTTRWKTERNPDFDYAAIHLDDAAAAVVKDSGFFSTAALSDADILGRRVNVSGYPGDKGNFGDQQWHHAKLVKSATGTRIFYDVDTYGGQSGSPVWVQDAADDPPRVVAIHAYGVSASSPTTNSGPRINGEVFEVIKGWVETAPGVSAPDAPRARRGLVRASNGDPIAGAMVVVVRGTGDAPDMALVSQADGSFTFNLPPGRYTLAARLPDGRNGEAELDTEMPGEVVIVVR